METNADYREVLRHKFSERAAQKVRYSMSSFARDLNLSPGRLFEILHGRQGLSREAALRIGQSLGLESVELTRFCDLAESEHGRSHLLRETAKLRLEKRNLEHAYRELEQDSFRVVSDWQHFALLRLLRCTHVENDLRWMADQLSISVAQVRAALKRLARVGLIKEERGQWIVVQDQVTTTNDVPSMAIRSFHKQILTKAHHAVEKQTVEERDLSAVMVTMDQREVEVAKKAIANFRRRMAKRLSNGPKRDSVYCLSIQFFKLNQGR